MNRNNIWHSAPIQSAWNLRLVPLLSRRCWSWILGLYDDCCSFGTLGFLPSRHPSRSRPSQAFKTCSTMLLISIFALPTSRWCVFPPFYPSTDLSVLIRRETGFQLQSADQATHLQSLVFFSNLLLAKRRNIFPRIRQGWSDKDNVSLMEGTHGGKKKSTPPPFFIEPHPGVGILKPSKKTIVKNRTKSQPAIIYTWYLVLIVFNSDMVASVALFSLVFVCPWSNINSALDCRPPELCGACPVWRQKLLHSEISRLNLLRLVMTWMGLPHANAAFAKFEPIRGHMLVPRHMSYDVSS